MNKCVSTWVLLAAFNLTSCVTTQQPKVVVRSSAANLDVPLSAVRFEKIELEGNVSDVVDQINTAMKKIGFPMGLNIGIPGEGVRVQETTHLNMRDVTLRQIIDQMCVQLRISYWDNARLRELYFYDGETTSFFMKIADKDGKYIPAGPPQFMPSGFAELPLRPAYFDMTIKQLAVERNLIPE
jgi:hypothetical protein